MHLRVWPICPLQSAQDDLAATLSNEAVAGRASDELHQMIDTVVVDWDAEAKVHRLELRGKLLELLNKKKPAGGAAWVFAKVR